MKAFAGVGLLVWMGLLLSAHAADRPVARLSFEATQFKPMIGPACPAETSTLEVPERHASDSGRRLSLPVLRFASTAQEPRAPIVFLAGGPGGSGIFTARSSRFALFRDLTAVADVVTFDQRGTGGCLPKLECRERINFPLDVPGDERAMLELLSAHCRQCAASLRAAGHDLAAYTTVESAHDIDLLRQALGVDKITLWGTSYGTHLSLAYARLYPQHVERLVLAGVEGPDHTLKLPSDQQQQLKRIDEWVQTDPDVRRAIPDFVALVRAVLERVEREPVTVELQVFGTDRKQRVAIGKWDLQLLTSNLSGRTRSADALPRLYYEMSQGDFTRVARMLQATRTGYAIGPMSMLMDGASGATPERLARIEREASECLLGDTVNFPFPGIAAAWDAPDLGDAFRGPLRLDVPVLSVSGSFDGRTPPSNAEEVLRGCSRGIHLIVENAGHDEDLFSASPELRKRIVQFVGGGEISTEPIVVARPRLVWPRRK